MEAQLLLAVEELDTKDQKKAALFEAVGNTIGQLVTGTFNPATAITGALGLGALLIGGGAYTDKRRTDKVLLDVKNASKDTTS